LSLLTFLAENQLYNQKTIQHASPQDEGSGLYFHRLPFSVETHPSFQDIRIKNKYRVERKIGGGGFGDVCSGTCLLPSPAPKIEPVLWVGAASEAGLEPNNVSPVGGAGAAEEKPPNTVDPSPLTWPELAGPFPSKPELPKRNVLVAPGFDADIAAVEFGVQKVDPDIQRRRAWISFNPTGYVRTRQNCCTSTEAPQKTSQDIQEGAAKSKNRGRSTWIWHAPKTRWTSATIWPSIAIFFEHAQAKFFKRSQPRIVKEEVNGSQGREAPGISKSRRKDTTG
jgi:hypothetical protein